jgi:hypothetical protein
MKDMLKIEKSVGGQVKHQKINPFNYIQIWMEMKVLLPIFLFEYIAKSIHHQINVLSPTTQPSHCQKCGG